MSNEAKSSVILEKAQDASKQVKESLSKTALEGDTQQNGVLRKLFDSLDRDGSGQLEVSDIQVSCLLQHLKSADI